jgi:transglutaminase-like putative cysteine protease
MSVNNPTKGWLTFTGILVFLYPEQDFLSGFLEWLTFTGMVAQFEPEYPDIDTVYRFWAKLNSQLKEWIAQTAFEQTLKTLEGKISTVFYEITKLLL